MKNILLIIILSAFLFNCKKENSYENDAELCGILAEMFESDQRIRKLPEMIHPYFEILDSIQIANSWTKQEFFNLTKEEQSSWRKIAREIAEKRPKVSKKVTDSLWEILSEIDIKNTKLLIDITKKRGWVNKDELGCDMYFAPVIIFRHAPIEFWEEIKPLIDKEYAEERMGIGDYEFIDHHLRGRPTVVD